MLHPCSIICKLKHVHCLQTCTRRRKRAVSETLETPKLITLSDVEQQQLNQGIFVVFTILIHPLCCISQLDKLPYKQHQRVQSVPKVLFFQQSKLVSNHI
jgi:hypothetical protein